MKELLNFMSSNPAMTVFILILAFGVVFLILGTTFKIINRFLRAGNIRIHGWPPPHLDADGDFPMPIDDEDKENPNRSHHARKY